MSAELVELAETAATTLVGAAATDAWGAVREAFLRLLGRGGSHAAAERRLSATSRQLEQAPDADRPRIRAQLTERWTTRLADLLEDNPGAAADLRDLLQSVGTLTGTTNTTNVTYVSQDTSTMIIAPGGTVNHTVHRNGDDR